MISIYTLSSSSEPNNIRYIGKTKNLKDRLRRHIGKYNLNSEISYKNNWIKSEILKGNDILIEELDHVNEEDWIESEKYWIEQFKNWGFKLVNTTIGGDGLNLTQELIEKRVKTRMQNSINSKSEVINFFKIMEIGNIFFGERKCPNCGLMVKHKSNNLNDLIYFLKSNIDKNCIYCPKNKIQKDISISDEYTEVFNIRKVDNDWIGERICPSCGGLILHKSHRSNNIIRLMKKSINRNCASCSSKIKTPFKNHTWTNKGKKYANTINPKIIKEKYGKKILQYDLEYNLINEFLSIRDASKYTKIDRKSISQCIREINGRKTAGGYIFQEKITK